MKYKSDLDYKIINILHEHITLHYNELFKLVNNELHISRDAFNYHLKYLIQQKRLSKRDHRERGKPVYYFLTEEAKDELRANCLIINPHKQKSEFHVETLEERRQKMYLLLLFAQSTNGTIHSLNDDAQLAKFLHQISPKAKLIRRQERLVETNSMVTNRLVVIITRKIFVPEIGLVEPSILAVPPYRLYVTNYNPIDEIKIWKERYEYYNIVRKYEKYEFTRNFQQERIRELKNKIGLKENDRIVYVYRYMLPGISLKEMMDKERFAFEHINLTRSETKKAIEMLKENNIIKPVYVLSGEIRYEIANESIRNLILDSLKLLVKTENLFYLIWNHVRKPTSAERKWFASIHGYSKSQELFREYYWNRKRDYVSKDTRKSSRKEKNIDIKNKLEEIVNDVDKLKRTHKPTVIKYRFPLNKLTEIISPEFDIKVHF